MRLIVLLLATLLAFSAYARGSHSGYNTSGHHNSNYCTTCERDSHGRIKRSPEATDEFKKSNPCPSTGKYSGACHGYVIDHIDPLKRGGVDAPRNAMADQRTS